MTLLRKRLDAAFRSIASARKIAVDEVEGIATDLIALAPVRHGRDLRGFAAGDSTSWLAAHSLLVAGLGIHFVECLAWTPGQVKKFALACLLHDVGMLFIPREWLLSPNPLSSSQRTLLDRHPELGREVIQAARAWGVQIHLVAQDHHERWDGSGYPGCKKGKEVDLPARIVGFLDCFSALVSRRPHRPPLLYSEALAEMARATERGLHDPAILAHFRSVFTDRPVGSCLRLADGRTGRVVGADPRNPRRHRVRILDAAGGPARDEPIWIEPEAPLVTEIPPPEPRTPAHSGILSAS